jgi:hypothetical protein
MASNINPQNIDGAYPVAGQDNDSQGFRDNFTNTRTNFSFAAAEITDLQNKAVLKAALDGTVLNNDMGGSILSNAQLQDMSETVVSGLSTTGAVTINYAAGSYQKIGSLTGNVSLGFTNFPPSGQLGRVRVQIIVVLPYTLTVTALSNMVGTSNIQGYVPTSAASGTITFNQAGTYEFEFETSDGGSNISIFDLNRNRDPMYLPSSEDLADAAAANLAVTTSYIATGASGETAQLAAGAAGQIKIFAMTTDGGGDMVITVANAAWGGAGTITFGDVGDGCTLIYVNSKWCCVGNNGCTFA